MTEGSPAECGWTPYGPGCVGDGMLFWLCRDAGRGLVAIGRSSKKFS